jgi:hypothetical protein
VTALGALFAAPLVACSGVADGMGERGEEGTEGVESFSAPGADDAVAERAASRGESSAEAAVPATIARVVVERSRSLDGSNSAQAMAHFVEVTPGAESSLELVGLHSPVLQPGQPCRTDHDAASANEAPVELELLDAGAVEIVLGHGNDGLAPTVVTLAPHAFPSISSFASGLVYTTRDRSADTLPSGAVYDIRVNGAQSNGAQSNGAQSNGAQSNGARSIPRLEFSGQAPDELTQVTLGGVPLEAVAELDAAAPLDVTWQVGRPGDIVVVELANPDDGSRRLQCSFADDLGSASIAPHRLLPALGKARLSLRRVRQLDADLGSLGRGSDAVRGELRFDFEITRALVLGDRVVTEPVQPDPLEDAGTDHESLGASPGDADTALAVP